MKILRIIIIIFVIYFIRRMIQAYKALKLVQRRQEEELRAREKADSEAKQGKVVDADFEVIDR